MLQVLTQPTALVVSRAEAKLYLRVNTDDDDALIDELLQTAQEQVEHDASICLQPTTLQESFRRFPHTHHYEYPYHYWNSVRLFKLRLLKRPLTAVASVTYYDVGNNLNTLPTTNYTVSQPTNGHGYLTPALFPWPLTFQREDAVSVSYTAGYTYPPSRAVQAIKVLVWGWYMHEDTEETYQRLVRQLNTGGYPA